MEIGFVGLGKMGGNMVLRLVKGSPDGKIKGGHTVVGYAQDPNPDLAGVSGVTIVNKLEDLAKRLKPPRVAWIMVPAGNATEGVLSTLAGVFEPGDLLIDGGNSHFTDSIRRGEGLATRKLGFVDVGTSGGIWGLKEGYCMMVGGEKKPVDLIKPILDTLAPVDGWAHMGGVGSGHFVKMVHNGIEYGLMAAYAEGFDVLHKTKHYKLDLHAVSKVWNRGSVIRSWLLELAELMFEGERSNLENIQPYVADSGEGRWTIHEAMEANVPVPVIAASLFARFASRDPENFAARFTAGLRNQFGGHSVKRAVEHKISSTGDVK